MTKIQAITPASISSPGAPSNTVAITFAGSTPTPAPSSYIFPGLYAIINKKSGQALEIGGGAASLTDGTLANQWPYVGTANQQWYIEYVGRFNNHSRYKIVNRNSGLALEIGDGKYDELGAIVNQWPYFGHRWQIWEFYGSSTTGIYNIRTIGQYGSNSRSLCLEIGGGDAVNEQPGALANIWSSGDSYNPEQFWELRRIDIESSARFTGVYSIKNLETNQALEIGEANDYIGAKANQRPYAGTANQQWTLVEAGDGFYKITNRNSGLALEIGGGTSDGNVQQWNYWGGAYQQWVINEISPGVFSIINRNSGQSLEMGGDDWSRSQPGARPNQWPYWGGNNQKWVIELVSQNRGTALGIPKAHSSANQTLTLYPNPASTLINVSLPGTSKLTSIKVTDVRGVLILATRYQGGGQLDIANLPTGIYVVTASDGKQEYRQKFVKQ